MREFIKKFAYKHSWTETQMLIDKLEQTPNAVGYNPQRRVHTNNTMLVEIAMHGAFPLIDRIAIAFTLAKLRRDNTKFRIVNGIFVGDMEDKQEEQRSI